MTLDKLSLYLEALYAELNQKKFVSPDPLEIGYDYENARDSECALFISSALAVGKASLIVKAANDVLHRLEKKPYECLINSNKRELTKRLQGFKYRFYSDRDMADFLFALSVLLKKYTSIEKAFTSCIEKADADLLQPLSRFSSLFWQLSDSQKPKTSLLASPEGKSACKRMCMYLRWMVRSDAVDPGLWTAQSTAFPHESLKSKLIIPLDTHMLNISQSLGFVPCNASQNIKTALLASASFAKLNPEDPVKYDFTLTRLGIREELDLEAFLQSCKDESE